MHPLVPYLGGMRNLFLAVLALLTHTAHAQPYALGSTTRTWYDAVRDRDVPAEIHYPAVADGAEQACATGSFPVLVVGHGFVMGVDAYVYLWQHYVPLGYVVVLPTTEGGLAPDHANFGADLAFAAERMQAENTDALSLFFGHISPSTALLGHSMGGGAALLGAEANANIQAVVVLAPAETNPSAIAAAGGVLVPTLVFGASEDCVTPLATNQQPMYDGLVVDCKALVNITGGGHCYFGDNNFLCNFGEITCGPALTITREEQHDVVTDLADLWLDGHLRGTAGALVSFADSLFATTRAVTQYDCFSTGIAQLATPTLSAWPVPAADRLMLSGVRPGTALHVVDLMGRTCPVAIEAGAPLTLNTASLAEGSYRVVLHGAARQVLPFVVAR